MEEVNKDLEKATGPLLSENQEANEGVSTQEDDTRVEVNKELQVEERKENYKLVTPERIVNLRRDLTTLVTNIQTAAKAKESMRRTELEEARRNRLEQIESNVRSSKEKFEEITEGWATANLKVIPQDLQEAVNSQQQLCAALIEDKKKLISDLKQELKLRDEYYVKDLRKQAEELDLMMERMEDQIQTLLKAYREELAQIESVYQQEQEVLLAKDKTKWEQCMKEISDKTAERLTHRIQKVEEYEAIVHNLMFDAADRFYVVKREEDAKFQALDLKQLRIQGEALFLKERQEREEKAVKNNQFKLTQMKSRLFSLREELKTARTTRANQLPQLDKESKKLSQDYQHSIQQYERAQMRIKHFAVADAKKFENMWITLEDEVKQLVERALVIDSLITKQILDLAGEQPPMAFLELSGQTEPQKQAQMQAVSGTARQSKSGTEVEMEQSAADGEGKVSERTVKKLTELMCDEMGFLIEEKNLMPLSPHEDTFAKICSLFSALSIDEEDVYKLAHFVLKYKQQQTEQSEDFCVDQAEELETSSTTEQTCDIHPNDILPALKCFVEKRMQHRESLTTHGLKVRDMDEAYWKRMGNIISADKLMLWDTAESWMKQYLAVLTEISELTPEVQSLEQQNAELRMLLQQSLNTRVSTELEIP